MFERGEVWWARWPDVGEKPVLVVSRRGVSLQLRPIVARTTSVARERSHPSTVTIPAGEVEGLPDESYIVCHDLYTLDARDLLRAAGRIPPGRLTEVEQALRWTLGLIPSVDP